MNRNYRNMNGLRFLMLILGLMMIVSVRQVRPDDETSEEEFDGEFLSGGAGGGSVAESSSSSSSSEEDDNSKGMEFYLNAMKDLHRQSKRQEAEPLVVARSGASAPIAALYRRSALNKNFIRFGRSGGGMMKTVSHQLQPTQPIRLMGLNESDSKDEERSFHPARPSRSLRSNFIRFGRSFFPASNRWGETVRRFARTPSAGRHMMSLVDLPVSSSRR